MRVSGICYKSWLSQKTGPSRGGIPEIISKLRELWAGLWPVIKSKLQRDDTYLRAIRCQQKVSVDSAKQGF